MASNDSASPSCANRFSAMSAPPALWHLLHKEHAEVPAGQEALAIHLTDVLLVGDDIGVKGADDGVLELGHELCPDDGVVRFARGIEGERGRPDELSAGILASLKQFHLSRFPVLKSALILSRTVLLRW
jgi:hypothetical protein